MMGRKRKDIDQFAVEKENPAISQSLSGRLIAEQTQSLNDSKSKPAKKQIKIKSKQSNDIDGMIYYNLQEVKAEKISWLWNNQIALGKLTLITGNPGSGKSQLTQAMFAAHVTRGLPFPDNSPCPFGSVIIINVEDDIADTIKPRLMASDVDTDKVKFIDRVNQQGKVRCFNIKDDISRLEELIVRIGDVKLVILDPITAMLGDKIDSNSNSDVRAVLSPICDLAARNKFALIGITHRPKSSNTAMNNFIGSIGFIAAARAAFIVLKDPKMSNRRYFSPIKNNIGNDTVSFAFNINNAQVEGNIETSCIKWDGGPVVINIKAIMSNERLENGSEHEYRSSLDEAKSFLLERFSEGDIYSEETFLEGKQLGISRASIRRAKKELKVLSYKEFKTCKGKWALPKNDEQVEQSDCESLY